jgi:hypothetical protein
MVTWTDVRGRIPQPLQAENTSTGDRAVEARLWHTPDAEKPYRVVITLLQGGAPLETWTREHGGPAGLNAAVRNYGDGRARAEQFVLGAPFSQCRPPQHWTITKGGAPE